MGKDNLRGELNREGWIVSAVPIHRIGVLRYNLSTTQASLGGSTQDDLRDGGG